MHSTRIEKAKIPKSQPIKLGPRFRRAFLFAAEKHARQVRKTSTIPYIAHLMGVASLVLEAGGDEDLAIAALLHDVVEDCGGMPMLKEVRRRFGPRVARWWTAVLMHPSSRSHHGESGKKVTFVT